MPVMTNASTETIARVENRCSAYGSTDRPSACGSRAAHKPSADQELQPEVFAARWCAQQDECGDAGDHGKCDIAGQPDRDYGPRRGGLSWLGASCGARGCRGGGGCRADDEGQWSTDRMPIGRHDRQVMR
jgi:hypothetical protein